MAGTVGGSEAIVEYRAYVFWARLSGAGVLSASARPEQPWSVAVKSRSPKLGASFGRGAVAESADIFALDV